MQSNIPKLRFKEFTDAWQEKKLGDIGDIIGGGTPDTSKPEYWGGDIYWLTPTEVKMKYIKSSQKQITKEGLKASSAKILPIGTIIFTSRATIGDIGISEVEISTNQGFQSVVVNNRNCNLFIYYWIKNNKKLFLRKSSGSTFLEIGKSEMIKIKGLFPDLTEQEKIAGFLTTVDEKINKLEEKKKGFEKYKKGVMQVIFSQKIRFKKSDSSNYPDWEEKKLGEVFTQTKGAGLSWEQVTETGINKCILYGELYTTYDEIISEIKSRTNLTDGVKSKKGDLLIPCSTTTSGIDLANVTELKEGDVLLGGDITVLREKKPINSTFYAYYLTHFKKNKIARYAQGSTIVHLYYNHFEKMIIDVPPIEEQEKIAGFLTSLDNKVELITKELGQAKLFKKSLLQQMFV